MKRNLLQLGSILWMLLWSITASNAQTIYSYTNATNGSYAAIAANVTASTLATVGTWGSNTPCSAGGGISGITVSPTYSTFNPTNASSPALNVNITPATGYAMTVSAISVSLRRSSTGPTKARLAYSTDGGTTWVDNGTDYAPNNGGCGSFSNNTWTLTVPLQVCSGVLKVRVYYFSAGAATGTCQTANLKVTGVVAPFSLPAVSIAASQSSVCTGGNVTFTATPTNPGTSPVYTWTKNGTTVGSNSNTYSDNTLTSTDVIICSMVSNAPCASSNSVSSNSISVIINPPVTYTFADTICASNVYNWAGQSLSATGSYNASFTSSVGCDSTVTLNLYVRPTASISFADTICNGTSYSWAGQTFSSNGAYTNHFVSIYNCDSIVTLNLFVRPAISYIFADTICAAASYNWGGQSLTGSGSYDLTFTSYTNCDSDVTLNLFVRPAISHSFADTICAATSYSWAGQSFATGGSYNHTFTSYTNCDSVVTLQLFVRPAIAYSFNDTICAATTYTWGGQTLAVTGSYNHTYTSYTNCDSIVTLHLFVRPANTNNVPLTICYGSSYTFGGQVLSSSGIYTHAFQAVNNCDSTVTLTLTVAPLITNAVSKWICAGGSFAWGSQVHSSSGIYTQTFTAASSCDSIVTLTLTVNAPVGDTISKTICFGATYNFGGQILNTSGDYTHVFTAANSCDSTVLLHLTVSPQILHNASVAICYGQTYNFGPQVLSATGNYTGVFTAASGCDSTVSLLLTVSPVPVALIKDTTSCGALFFEGTLYNTSNVLKDTFRTTAGCDSVYRTVNMTIHDNNTFVKTIDTTGCNSILFEGNVYSSSQLLIDTLHSYLGCDSLIRHINIVVNPVQHIGRDVEICAGNVFNFNGKQYNKAGVYPVSFVNSTGCDSTIILTIKVNVLPKVQVTEPDAVSHCIHDSVRLEASGANTYNWLDSTGVADNSIMKALLFDHINTISVVGTDLNGCIDTASITINAETCCNLWMPNAFSPNGDGLNDRFKPESKGHPNDYAIRVFNRWGKNIFVSYDIENGWDGNADGQQADIGTYYYTVTGRCTNGEPIQLKGSFTLVR